MPLYKTIHVSEQVVLHIWKIIESEEELSRGIELTENCENRVRGMKSELHRRGFLSIRHLMQLEGYEDKDLYYDELGKPHLYDGSHISITHSYHFTGIIVSKKEKVGIDIEKQRDIIKRIAFKFTTYNINTTERSQGEVIKDLTVLWGAKESLYKISSIPGISFRKNIFIEPDFANKDWFSGELNYNNSTTKHRISYLEFEGFTCVYALKQ